MNYSYNFLALNQDNDISFFKYLSEKVSVLTLLDSGLTTQDQAIGFVSESNTQSDSGF